MSENKTSEAHRNILRKRKQRRTTLEALYSDFLEENNLAGNALMPTIIDLLQLPEFNALIANDDHSLTGTPTSSPCKSIWIFEAFRIVSTLALS